MSKQNNTDIPYRKKVYTFLKENYTDFGRSESEFYEKLDTDSGYAKQVYGLISSDFDDFGRDEGEFLQLITPKKKNLTEPQGTWQAGTKAMSPEQSVPINFSEGLPSGQQTPTQTPIQSSLIQEQDIAPIESPFVVSQNQQPLQYPSYAQQRYDYAVGQQQAGVEPLGVGAIPDWAQKQYDKSVRVAQGQYIIPEAKETVNTLPIDKDTKEYITDRITEIEEENKEKQDLVSPQEIQFTDGGQQTAQPPTTADLGAMGINYTPTGIDAKDWQSEIGEDYFTDNMAEFIQMTKPMEVYGRYAEQYPEALAYFSPIYWTKMENDLKKYTNYSDRQIGDIMATHKEELRGIATQQINKEYLSYIGKRFGLDKDGSVKKLTDMVIDISMNQLTGNDFKIAQMNVEMRDINEQIEALDPNSPTYQEDYNKLFRRRQEVYRGMKDMKDDDFFYDPMTGEKVTDKNKVKEYNEVYEQYLLEYSSLAGSETTADQLLSELINTWTEYTLWNNDLQDDLGGLQRGLLNEKKEDSKMFDIDPVAGQYLSEQDRLQAKFRALSLLYNSMKSPVEVKKNIGFYFDEFQTGLYEGIGLSEVGIYDKELRETDVRFLQEVENISNELGIELTDEEKNKVERNIMQDVVRGTGAMIPMVGKFAIMNGLLGRAGVLKWVEGMRKSEQASKMVLGVMSHVAKEAVVFNAIGGSPVEGGAFGLATMFLPNLLKVTQFSPAWMGLMNNMYKASVGITVGGVAGEVAQATYDSIFTDDNFADIMKAHYPEASDFGRHVLVGLITNSMFGINSRRPMAKLSDLKVLHEKAAKDGRVEAADLFQAEIGRIEGMIKEGKLIDDPYLSPEHTKEINKIDKETKKEKRTESKIKEDVAPVQKVEVVEPVKEAEAVVEKQTEVKPEVVAERVAERTQSGTKEPTAVEVIPEKAAEAKTEPRVEKQTGVKSEIVAEAKAQPEVVAETPSVEKQMADFVVPKLSTEQIVAKKVRIAESADVLADYFGVKKMVEGGKKPTTKEAVKALVDIATNLMDIGAIKAGDFINDLKTRLTEKTKDENKIKEITDFIELNKDKIRDAWTKKYAPEKRKPKTEIQKKIEDTVSSVPKELVNEYNKLKLTYKAESPEPLTGKEQAKAQQVIADQFIDFAKANRNEIRKISPTKYTTILKRAAALRPGSKRFTQKVDNLIEYMEEVFVKSEAQRQMRVAETNRKTAAKIAKSPNIPLGTRTSEVKGVIADIRLKDLTPEQVVDFNRTMSEFLKSGRRQTPESINRFLDGMSKIDFTPKEKAIKTKAEVEDYIDQQLEREIGDYAEFKSAVSGMRKARRMVDSLLKENKITEQEAEIMLDKIQNKYDSESLVSKIEAGGDVVSREMKSNISNNIKEYNNKRDNSENTGLNEAQQRDADNIAKLYSSPKVREKLTLKELELLEYVSDNINNGFVNGYTAEAVRTLHDIYKFESMKESAAKFENNKGFRRFQNMVLEQLGATKLLNRLRAMDLRRIGENLGDRTNEIDSRIFKPLSKDGVTAKNFTEAVLKDTVRWFERLKKENSNIVSRSKGKIKGQINKRYEEAVVRLSIWRTERHWQNNMQQDVATLKEYSPTDGSRAEYMRNYWDSIAKKNIADTGVRDAHNYKMTTKEWEKIKKDPKNFNSDGSLNIDYMYSKMTLTERDLMDSLDWMFEKVSAYVENSAMKHGRSVPILSEYDFMHIVIEKTNSKNDNLGKDWSIDGLLRQSESPTRQAGQTHERSIMPKIIRTDMHNTIPNSINDISRDVFLRDGLLSTMRGIRKWGGTEVDGKKDTYMVFADALNNTIANRVVREAGKLQVWDEAISQYYSFLSKSMLGNPVRIPKEFTANTIRNVVSNGLDTGLVEGTYKDIMYEAMENKKAFSKYSSDMREATTLGGKAIQEIVIFSDKAKSPIVFKKEFKKSFKEITGEEFSITEYKKGSKYLRENWEAIEKAQGDALRRVEELYNSKTMFDPATHIRFFWGSGASKDSVIGKTGYYLMSFNHNEARQMSLSFRRAFSKNSSPEERARGIRDMVSLPLSNAVYMQMGFAMSKVLFHTVKSATDDDYLDMGDAFMEGMQDYYNTYIDEGKIFTSITSSLSSLAIGKYSHIVQPITGMLMPYAANSKQLTQKQKEDFEQWAKGMYIKPIRESDPLKFGISKLHPGAQELVNMWDIVEKTIDVAESIDSDGNMDAETWELVYLTNELVRYFYMNPISNIIHNEIKKQKIDWEKEKKKSNVTIIRSNKYR